MTGIVLFAAIAATLAATLTSGSGWYLAGALLFLAFSLAGFLDSLTCRIEMSEATLVVVRNFRRREYARSDLVKVTWGKGVAVAVQNQCGTWITLPEVGASSQALANALRAWIKR